MSDVIRGSVACTRIVIVSPSISIYLISYQGICGTIAVSYFHNPSARN